MKIWTRTAGLATAVLFAGVTVGYAGGEKCAEQHTQASYEQMAKNYAAKGYLGIETEKVGEGRYAISKITAGSPAEKAGFRQGDVLLGINGVRFANDNHDAVKKAKSALGPGKTATYIVARGGSEKQLSATLVEVPRELLAQWVGEHVIDHTGDQIATK